MLRHTKQISGLIFILLFIAGCSCSESVDNKKAEETTEAPPMVWIQMAYPKVEGLSICSELECKHTDADGMAVFSAFGRYTFRINQMELGSINVENNRTLVTPANLMSLNDAYPKWLELFLHACDRDEYPDDERVLLTFSPFIPSDGNFTDLLENSVIDGNLSYSTSEHNITIDAVNSFLLRDAEEYNLTLVDSEIYTQLANFTEFVTRADEHNASFFSTGEKLLVTSETLTRFDLGDRYQIQSMVENGKLMIKIYDYSTYEEQNAVYLSTDDENLTLITDLMTLSVVQ